MTQTIPDGPEECDVAVVGGGPAGLALAAGLCRHGVARVTVLERERATGGVPRHSDHYPFGVHEYRRLMTGPAYARRHTVEAETAGARIRTGIGVVTLHEGGRLGLSTPDGAATLTARRVALCTGAREASRAQRLLGGARQRGVITTGALQALVTLENLKPFRRPVILGTELVSFSALLTCRHAGIHPAAMIEEGPRLTARRFAGALPALLGVPVILGAEVRGILGQDRVEGVEIADASGNVRVIEADGVICTGAFRPEAALLHAAQFRIDPATGGPEVDQYGRTSDPAYFAAGNLLRPIETATWCSREGRITAAHIARDLAAPFPGTGLTTPIHPSHAAIRYVMPQCLSADTGPGAMRHLQIRLTRPARGRLVASADGHAFWSTRLDSVPERRLLAPLAPFLDQRGAPSISLTLEES